MRIVLSVGAQRVCFCTILAYASTNINEDQHRVLLEYLLLDEREAQLVVEFGFLSHSLELIELSNPIEYFGPLLNLGIIFLYKVQKNLDFTICNVRI